MKLFHGWTKGRSHISKNCWGQRSNYRRHYSHSWTSFLTRQKNKSSCACRKAPKWGDAYYHWSNPACFRNKRDRTRDNDDRFLTPRKYNRLQKCNCLVNPNCKNHMRWKNFFNRLLVCIERGFRSLFTNPLIKLSSIYLIRLVWLCVTVTSSWKVIYHYDWLESTLRINPIFEPSRFKFSLRVL